MNERANERTDWSWNALHLRHLDDSPVVLVVVLTVEARALGRTRQVGPKALAVFSNAAIVLARASQTCYFRTDLKGVGTLFETLLNGRIPLALHVGVGIEAANARTHFFVASLATLKARAVEFQTTRANAVAGNLTGRELVNDIANTGRHKRPWIAGENGPNGLGSGAVLAALADRVLAPQAAARIGAAASSCLEAIAIERNTLGLGAAASRRIQLQRSNFQSRRAQEVELVKTLGPLGGGLLK
jgi:hypothetical protein